MWFPGPRVARFAAAILVSAAALVPVDGTAGIVPTIRAPAADESFAKLADEFLDHWLSRRPHLATRLGLHDADPLLIPVTEASLDREKVWMRDFRRRLTGLGRDGLSFERSLEYDVIASRVERELLDLEVIRPFETNPNAYLDLVAGSIQSLLQRDFAALCLRLRSTARRLSQVPEVLRAARINLRNPPRIYTEIAITQFEGALRLYRQEVPAAAAGCKDSRTQADLAEADSAAVRATEEFLAFLRDDLLPRSNGSFALGRETYQRKLAYDEMERTPVDSLLAQGRKALDETEQRMKVVAERIAPGLGVRAALDSLERDVPGEGELVEFVAKRLDGIRAFLRARDLLTMPLKENLIVRETPAYRRSLSFASMESPGVWERRASEAYYNVTPAEPTWTALQKRDHLAFFNRYAAEIVSVHEALPGHYYQFLALQKVPSRFRQVLGAGSNTEGWAHYCEQMAVEQGLGEGDPRYELAQLLLAIRRVGRLVVGISLHTQGMSYEQAVQLFQERCYMEPVNAEREARRGTMDPTYLVYTLGKWRILELREELRQRLGTRFRLREFHDSFLKQGAWPLPLVRAAMLHDMGLAADTGSVGP